MNKISHIITNISLYVCFKNHSQCFHSTRVTQSLRVLVPHNVTEPFISTMRKEMGLSFMESSLSRCTSMVQVDWHCIYICKGSCKSVDHLWLVSQQVMICGPLFCCFWGTSVDAKKVIDAYSCWNGTHSHNINIIIRLAVPRCLTWTIGVTEPLKA